MKVTYEWELKMVSSLLNLLICLIKQADRFHNHDDPFWKELWKSKLHERIKMLMWRIAGDVIPTRQKLGQFISCMDRSCMLCDGGEENLEHLFFDCCLAKCLWFVSPFAIRSERWSVRGWRSKEASYVSLFNLPR